MSATTAPMTLDITSTSQVSMSRLVIVEIRKALDTRAGRWFAASILGLVVVVEVIWSFAAHDGDRDLRTYLAIAGGTLGYFLPILIIMLVTAEASQRNGLVTFTLEPRRPRVVGAKLLAGIVLTAGMLVLAVVLALLGTLLGTVRGGPTDWSVTGHLIGNALILSQLIGILVGFALATLIMNTAGAIVAYFAYTFILPVALNILSEISEGFGNAVPWFDFNTAQSPLVSGDFTPTGTEWLQIILTGTIWLIVPLALGIWRLLRIEFK